MIIQCDHCSAKFRIDDAKLANGAVKVRCAKCKEVFVVESDASPVEPLPTPQAEVQPAAPPARPDFSDDSFGESSDFSFDHEQPTAATAGDTKSPAADEFDWKDSSVSMDAPDSLATFESPSFAAEPSTTKTYQESATAAAADNEFDFGDINLQASSAGGSPPVSSAPQDDFSIDFGEISFAAPPVPSSEKAGSFADASAADFSFDDSPETSATPAATAHDDFLLSFNADQVDESKSPPPAAGGSDNVNFGDFSFGDMGEEEKGDQAVTHEPLPLSQMDSDPAPFLADSDEELVPTSLASRKKSGSRFPLFLIFGAIVLIVVLAGAGVFFVVGPQAFSKVGLGFLVDWYGDTSAEEGNVTVTNSTASYIINSSAGELFVVKGEAVNNFKKPRASIQVKVSILGPGGTVLVSKSAFCGNSLSNEQLTSLPLAKIEEAMNNQFGDSLANLGVKPGKSIPFVVVVSAVPKEATDFSVQIVGSTVATQ